MTNTTSWQLGGGHPGQGLRPPRLSLCLSEMHEAEWGRVGRSEMQEAGFAPAWRCTRFMSIATTRKENAKPIHISQYGRLLEVTVTRALSNLQVNNTCQHLNARFTVESAQNMGGNRSIEPPDWAVWWGSGSVNTYTGGKTGNMK